MEISVFCHRCETELKKVTSHEIEDVAKIYVEPHLCSIYVDDNDTKMEQVKTHNNALQERNTELVEENRKLAARIEKLNQYIDESV